MTTKENILYTALRLFARYGYEATSVSTIAGELSMTKGALYKHYKNKRAIFDSIVERLYEADREQAAAHGAPEETFDQAPDAFGSMTLEQMVHFIESQFRFLLEDAFASNVRKMLLLEQYRNPDMAKLYHDWLTAGPVSYIEDLLREMTVRGIWNPGDPHMLALELYGPFYLLLCIADCQSDKAEAMKLLTAHVNRFIERNAYQSSKE